MHRELRSERPRENTIRNLRMLNVYMLAIGSYLRLPNSLRNIEGWLLGRCVPSKKFSSCGQSIRTFSLVLQHHSHVRTELDQYPYEQGLLSREPALICQHTHAKCDHIPGAYSTSHSLLFHHPAGRCWLPVRQASLRYLWCWRDG